MEVLRIPNPGSDIDSFIRIYREIFDALQTQFTFGLDDISRVLVERNLATSSGYMGTEALRRSYNQDRSLDRLYNQSKMYSELYRMLGWLHPTATSALTFQFTYLGAHVVSAHHDVAAIFRESILGIAYPNAVLNVKGAYILRPFATILRTIDRLGGLLTRDEMIVGPLCLDDDTQAEKFEAMVMELRSLRRNWRFLQERLQSISIDRDITTTTMGNYTRFPLAVLKWLRWTENKRDSSIYHRPMPFLILTPEGKKAVTDIEGCLDIRKAALEHVGKDIKSAVARIGFYQMLERAGFEIDGVRDQIAADQQQARMILGVAGQPLLFSPFQELEPAYTAKLFPKMPGKEIPRPSSMRDLLQEADREYSDGAELLSPSLVLRQRHSKIALSASGVRTNSQVDPALAALLEDATTKVGSELWQIANHIAENQRLADKTTFYPFVASLFRALGYDCRASRAGVNSQRSDAFIYDSEFSIPIEIKSPGEEEFLSVKAVRQALENKIILLARKSFVTQPTTTSLVVGYNLPNDRSEVASLVDNVYQAYGIVIGVIDLRSLLRLVAAAVLQGKQHNPEDLRNLHGIIEVTDSNTKAA